MAGEALARLGLLRKVARREAERSADNQAGHADRREGDRAEEGAILRHGHLGRVLRCGRLRLRLRRRISRRHCPPRRHPLRREPRICAPRWRRCWSLLLLLLLPLLLLFLLRFSRPVASLGRKLILLVLLLLRRRRRRARARLHRAVERRGAFRHAAQSVAEPVGGARRRRRPTCFLAPPPLLGGCRSTPENHSRGWTATRGSNWAGGVYGGGGNTRHRDERDKWSQH